MALTPSVERAAQGFGMAGCPVSEALAAIADHAHRHGNLLTFADAVELARLTEAATARARELGLESSSRPWMVEP